jgi:HAD superfamily hydrolase (TIGR01509 family)
LLGADSSRDLKALAFDLGNVLVKVDHGRFCRGLAQLAGLSPEEVFAQVLETDLEMGYDTGRLSSREFYELVQSRLGVKLPFADFGHLWSDIFAPMAEMEAVLALLAPRYPLFLLSNTNPLHFDYIREQFPSLLTPFKAFILSYRVGSRKPDPGIYQALIRQAGYPPPQILYLDDKPPFVEAARGQGLAAWHFTTPEDFQQRLDRYELW